jgi:RNA polymerase primary sigma factor
MGFWAINAYREEFREPLEASAERIVIQALSKLAPREEKVLKMRFGIGSRRHRLEEIARVYEDDITKERVRQIEARALRKMRDPTIASVLLKLI